MPYETVSLNSQLTDIKPQQMLNFRAIVYDYQHQNPMDSHTLNVESGNVDRVSKSSFSSPEIREAIEETLHEGAEVWKELAKY
jgi:hypothetical protein